MEIDIKSAFADLDKQKKNIMIESRIAEEDVVEKAIKNAKEDLEISQGEQHTIIASIEQKSSLYLIFLIRRRNCQLLMQNDLKP